MGELSENIGSFRSEYGRMCVLIAQALQHGHTANAVIEAAQGLSLPSTHLLVQIRQQRERANRAYFEAKRAGCPRNVIVDVAREARHVVSGEYMAELPLLKGATA